MPAARGDEQGREGQIPASRGQDPAVRLCYVLIRLDEISICAMGANRRLPNPLNKQPRAGVGGE